MHTFTILLKCARTFKLIINKVNWDLKYYNLILKIVYIKLIKTLKNRSKLLNFQKIMQVKIDHYNNKMFDTDIKVIFNISQNTLIYIHKYHFQTKSI